MDRRQSLLRLALLAALGLAVSGFGPGGCGLVFDTPCSRLDEARCKADPSCQPEYAGPACLCAPCQDPSVGCPPCACPTTFAGCSERPEPIPPERCVGYDERTCLATPGCVPVYNAGPAPTRCDADGTRCAGEPIAPVPPIPPSTYAGCQPGCAPVTCKMACPNGFARDASGCEICACAPEGCFSDSDCGPGERCEIPFVDCPRGAECGVAIGTCKPAEVRCLNDADCKSGQHCELYAGCSAIGCPPPVGICRDNQTCPGVLCDLYCPSGFEVDANGCEICRCREKPVCEPLTCKMACEYGFEVDANGCATCVCRAKPVCEPLACRMVCDYGLQVDANGCEICACNPAPKCLHDSECAAGQYCELQPADPSCPPNAPCGIPRGVCKPLNNGCNDDSQCAVGEICWIECGTPPVYGTCINAECMRDEDCGAGQVCRPDPKDPCSAPNVMCFKRATTICQQACRGLDEKSCTARRDCKAKYGPSVCSADGICTADIVFKSCE